MKGELIEKLAQKLGVTAEYLWSALLRQAVISGIFDLVFFGLEIVCIFLLIKWWKRTNKKVEKGDWEETAYVPLVTATVIVGVMFLISLACLSLTFAAFYNPEYWALHEILSAIKGN